MKKRLKVKKPKLKLKKNKLKLKKLNLYLSKASARRKLNNAYKWLKKRTG